MKVFTRTRRRKRKMDWDQSSPLVIPMNQKKRRTLRISVLLQSGGKVTER